MVASTAITGPIAPIANIGTRCAKEPIRLFDALQRFDHWLRPHMILPGQPSICSTLKTV